MVKAKRVNYLSKEGLGCTYHSQGDSRCATFNKWNWKCSKCGNVYLNRWKAQECCEVRKKKYPR